MTLDLNPQARQMPDESMVRTEFATIRDPASFAAWLVPVVSGVLPR